jgi:hypothetical protein
MNNLIFFSFNDLSSQVVVTTYSAGVKTGNAVLTIVY